MKMEKETYLSCVTFTKNWISERSSQIRLIHRGKHFYSNLFSCWYFSRRCLKTNRKSTRPVNSNPVRAPNQLTNTQPHVCNDVHKNPQLVATTKHLLIQRQTPSIYLLNLQIKQFMGAILSWHSMKKLTVIPSHLHVLEIHLHSSATLPQRRFVEICWII